MANNDSKHAYLVLAHKNWRQLSLLIKLLDDYRNDIFIHIDKKSNLMKEDELILQNSACYSTVFFIKRSNVSWGGSNMVTAEQHLLHEALTKQKYDYYHLLSGQDLPIKTQDYIHSFFDNNIGKEFITFAGRDYSFRIKYYWLFQNYIGNSHRIDKKILRLIDRVSVTVQRKLGVNRIKSTFDFSAGSQWFSITDGFARYIDYKKEFIKKILNNSICGDESLAQILAVNSGFCSMVFSYENGGNNMRLVDWEKGSPYIYKAKDFSFLMESECLFARKFDINVDEEIIMKIYDRLISNRIH